jgi:hypothetical protein
MCAPVVVFVKHCWSLLQHSVPHAVEPMLQVVGEGLGFGGSVVEVVVVVVVGGSVVDVVVVEVVGTGVGEEYNEQLKPVAGCAVATHAVVSVIVCPGDVHVPQWSPMLEHGAVGQV